MDGGHGNCIFRAVAAHANSSDSPAPVTPRKRRWPWVLGAIALALSVTTLEVAASWLLAAWVLVMAYAFASLGMRTFAESPAVSASRSVVVESDRADH